MNNPSTIDSVVQAMVTIGSNIIVGKAKKNREQDREGQLFHFLFLIV